MTYINTLPFQVPSDIVFIPSSNDIRILVKGVLLGAINRNFPVTLYVTETGSSKTITIKEISASDYTAGNTNDYYTDTIAFDYAHQNSNLHVDFCNGSTCCYKTIGWEDDAIGQSCTGSNGTSNLFDINAVNNFKAKLEQVTQGSITKWKMVVRYSSAVNTQQSQSSALCYGGLYCYYCC